MLLQLTHNDLLAYLIIQTIIKRMGSREKQATALVPPGSSMVYTRDLVEFGVDPNFAAIDPRLWSQAKRKELTQLGQMWDNPPTPEDVRQVAQFYALLWTRASLPIPNDLLNIINS